MADPRFFAPTGERVSRIRLAAAALIPDAEGRILLQQRSDNGHWGMPGGGVEPGEPIGQAVVREVMEEMGLRVRVERLLGIYSDPAIGQLIRHNDGRVTHMVVATFVCAIESGSLRLSEESLDSGWFAHDKLPSPMMPSHAVRIADFRTGEIKAFVR
jgi:glycerol 3-phosphatase-2